MSQQHSFDLGDRRLEPQKGAPSKQSDEEIVSTIPVREPMPSENLSATSSSPRVPMREAPKPASSSDPGVPLTQEVVEAVFGPVGERTFAVRYWDGTFEPAGATSTPEFTIALQRRGALRRIEPAPLSGDESGRGRSADHHSNPASRRRLDH